MKQFIVLIATLPLTLLLLMQISHEQINMAKLMSVERSVEIAEEQAKRDGYFTEENKEQLAAELKRILEISDSELVLNLPGAGNIKYRTEQISYKIEAPFKNVMVGNRFLGIRDEDNVSKIIIDRQVTSEKLRP